MKVIDLIKNSKEPVFSFEILPPLKGNSIQKVYHIIDKLREFDPKYINITSHHSEIVYLPQPDGNLKKTTVRKRPGTVAIAAAIQNKYGIQAVPHIICKGFTKEETEYALLDLNFLGINNLLLLRGDSKPLDIAEKDLCLYHEHATDLQEQVNRFNQGIGLDGSKIEGIETPFSYGMACYPEKHEEAPNIESDLYWLKKKVEAGAEYAVTQLFYDNKKYFEFVEQAKAAGINIPIIPGIKPFKKLSQLSMIPKTFKVDLPEDLVKEALKCKNDAEAERVGIEWCVTQCKELMSHGVPSIHFYSIGAVDSIKEVAKIIY